MTDTEFHKQIKASLNLYKVTPKQIANAIDVSTPTVERWIQGLNFPCPVMRPVVFKTLNKVFIIA